MRSFAEVSLCLALALAARGARAEERCAPCHAALREPRLRAPAEQVRDSVHAAPLVGCASCHGGRPDEATASAHDVAAGFVARPPLADVTERCGACHADARFVRRASDSLPTDQLALFRADAHGRAVAAGRVRAPSCVSCHGAHDIRPTRDLRSPVHPARVADTCGRCHAEAAAVRGERPRAEAPAAWRGSVHGVALLERHQPGAPSCSGCHGAHGEYREAGGAEGRCGACHRDEAAAVARGPHAQPFARLGFGPCTQCHGTHAITSVDGALLGGGAANVCARCHGGAQRALEVAGRLDAARAGALRALDDARDALARADAEGAAVPEAAARLDAARAAKERLDVVLHTLDEPAAREAADVVAREAAAARAAVARVQATRHRQRRAWAPVALLFVALGALLALRARQGSPR